VTKGYKCLVIDTDIARSAGGENTQDERSKSCRDFLLALRHTKHKVVTTETIRDEWHKHQSRFTRAWLVSMVAQKKVCWIDAPADGELRTKVIQATTIEKKREAMLKDIHLVEASLQADRIVISMDELVRHCFRELSQKVRILGQIAWVNPCKNEESPLDWLQHGAELERERLLGYRAKATKNAKIHSTE
jgi:hypothetical protein